MMPTEHKSYKHTGFDQEKVMKRPDYEKARDSKLETRDDFKISSDNRPNWFDDKESKPNG